MGGGDGASQSDALSHPATTIAGRRRGTGPGSVVPGQVTARSHG
jgi:hypothetical protein